MTKLEQQKNAVSMAVSVALHNIGADWIKNSEFFGTNQRNADVLSKAA